MKEANQGIWKTSIYQGNVCISYVCSVWLQLSFPTVFATKACHWRSLYIINLPHHDRNHWSVFRQQCTWSVVSLLILLYVGSYRSVFQSSVLYMYTSFSRLWFDIRTYEPHLINLNSGGFDLKVEKMAILGLPWQKGQEWCAVADYSALSNLFLSSC